jgi:hypothetical protein
MSLAMTGSEITIHEVMLVPGDYVHFDVLYETDTWQGDPVIKQPPSIPLQIEGAKQFGSDPHKETVDKISAALITHGKKDGRSGPDKGFNKSPRLAVNFSP